VNENFQFFGKTLTGAQELRSRLKRCVQAVDGDLGEALGQKYVELTFGAEGKERTLKMVHALEAAMEKDIKNLTWMTPATKEKALEKLHAIANKIGYPEKWKTYSGLTIRKDDALGNSCAPTNAEAGEHGQDREAGGLWGMVHEPADGECLLQIRRKQYQFSRWHFAASVL